MPRGGPPTYTYSLPAIYLAVPGTLITAAQHNTPLEDIALTFNSIQPVVWGGSGANNAQGAVSNFFDGTTYVLDEDLLIADPGDITSRVNFDVSAVASATTRTISVPDYDGTIAYASAVRGALFGLTLSNNAVDATNDLDIAAGSASSSDTTPVSMVLAAALTKRLDAAWAVGTGNGGLDTGSIADGTYHVYLIMRLDTGVVDAIFSTSAIAPTLPTDYTLYRRIGSIVRASSAIREFYQRGDRFMYRTAIQDRSSTSAQALAVIPMSVPTGLETRPIFSQNQQCNSAGVQTTTFSDVVNGTEPAPFMTVTRVANEQAYALCDGALIANGLGRLSCEVVITSGTLSANITTTYGWYDSRGRED